MTEAAPEWAKGYPLEFLKECAAIFKAEFKPHTYGAFGIPKERDIADAHSIGSLLWTKDEKGAIEAVALFRRAIAASQHEDFAGRIARPLGGDVIVRAIAGSPAAKQRLLTILAQRSRTPMWVETHIENQEMTEGMRALGFRLVMTKISASSDLKALWLRDEKNFPMRLPPPLDPADEPGVKILKADFLGLGDLGAVMDELDRRNAGDWAQHYSSYNKRSSWTSFALCGYDQDDPSFIIKPAEMSKDWKAKNPQHMATSCFPTVMAQKFPEAMKIVDRIPGRKQRVRFMRLSAGNGELTRHSDITDPEAGTKDDQIARLHIPIHTDPRCVFRSWGLDGQERRLHFPARALCYIDTRKPHAVINPSDVERIHLVIDTYSTPALRRMLADG